MYVQCSKSIGAPVVSVLLYLVQQIGTLFCDVPLVPLTCKRSSIA